MESGFSFLGHCSFKGNAYELYHYVNRGGGDCESEQVLWRPGGDQVEDSVVEGSRRPQVVLTSRQLLQRCNRDGL